MHETHEHNPNPTPPPGWKQYFLKYKYWIIAIFVLLIIIIFFLTRPKQYGLSLYVSKTGNDNNAGTAAAPFLTIQKAASVASSGAVVTIEAGTYRETVTPSANSVTFQAAQDAAVVVSGLEAIVSPWTVHSGQIYKTTVTLPVNGFSNSLTSNTTILANQVFKGGDMLFQARWPDVSKVEDLIDRGLPGTSNPGKYRHFSQTQGLGRTSTTDNGMPNGNFTGASIWVTGWFISETRTITGQNGKTISYSQLNENPKFQRWYYITNDLELLNSPKEWHYENNTLYLWPDGNGPPTGIEYKKRNWGFDLRGKDNTKIIGLQFIGCEPATGDTGTDGTVIDNIRASYTNHAFVTGGDHAYFNATQTGIKLLGRNNTIKNSEFRHISCQVIWAAEGAVIENNLLYNHGWEGNYAAFVTPWGQSGGNIKILRNTAYRLGRSAVDFYQGHHPNIEIGYNHFYQFSMVTSDVGATYGARGVNITGTRIHHNFIHDNMVVDGWRNSANFDGIHVNIYFDQGAGPSTVDHNVLWNGSVGDFYSEIKGVLTNIYNNTFGTTGDKGERETYFCPHASPSDVQKNNIYRYDVNIAWKYATSNDNANQPGDVSSSIFKTTNPLFVGPEKTGSGYRLQSNSPAINAGVSIAGITEGSIGAPDAGAYEYGAPEWTAGYVASGTVPPIPPDTIPEPPDTIPKPPDHELKDTVPKVKILKGYRMKGLDVEYETYIPEAGRIEAETGELYKAGIENSGNVSVVCCIDPGATLKYGTKTSTSKILIRYSRGNAGSGTLKITVGGETKDLTFESTGGWSVFREKTFDIKAGTGAFEFSSSVQGPANLDYYEFLKP